MVFESLVIDLLNKYLGEYVENLDASQLRIGIWGGDVVLNNLVLKQSALDELDLPIRTVYGVLEKLVLKIPWKNLYNDKVEATVERLFLLAVPNQEVKYDPVREERWAQDAKQLQLKRVEDAKKREAEKGMAKADDSFIEKLTTQIIKNVEVKIGEIHIRYEDRISNIGRPFALGVTLFNLAVQTTDSNWKKTLISEASNIFYKELTLEGLSIYLNSNCIQFSEQTPEEMITLFEKGIVTRDATPQGYDYMLGPINSSARLRINPKPEMDASNFTIPKMELTVELETLSVGIGKNQYQDLMLLMESMDWMMRAAPYRKYRPFVSGYRGNYKEWWQFAYKCILEEEVRRRRRNWDWRMMRDHRDMCKTYAELYRAKLLTKRLSQDTQERITDLEKRLDVFNIMLIRQRIEVQVSKDTEEQKKQQQERKGWFSSWWGGAASTTELVEPSTAADLAKKFEAAMTPEEKAKLFRAIDYNENALPTIYPDIFVEQKFSFKMNSLDILFKNEELSTKTILVSSLQDVKALVEQRKSGQALKVKVNIRKFTVEGTQQGKVTPLIVSSKLIKDMNTMLLDVLFETQPLDETCDQRMRVDARPLRIIYDACTVNNIIDLFRPPEVPTLQSKLQMALPTPALKEMSVFGLQYAVEKQSRFDIMVDFMSSHIVIPQNGLYLGEENALIANLGRMTVVTVHREQTSIKDMHLHGKTDSEILDSVMLSSYTRFEFKLEDIQVLMAYAGEDWKKILLHVDQSPLHLVRPFSFTMNIDKCAVLDDPRLPKVRVAAEVGDINLELPDDRLLCCINLHSSIPFNVADPTPLGQTIHSDNVSRSSQLSVFVDKMTGKGHLAGGLSKNLLPKIEKETPPLVQATDIHAKFTMNHIFITVYVHKQSTSPEESEIFQEAESENTAVSSKEEPWDANLTKLLTFRLLNFQMDFISCTFDTKINMTLGLIDLTQQYDGYDIEIIGTPRMGAEDHYLLSAKFVQVDRRSPEFRTIHQSTLKRIEIDFASLNLILHLEAMLRLMSFVNNIQDNLDKPLSAPSSKLSTQKPSSRRLTTITEDSGMSRDSGAVATKVKIVAKRRKRNIPSIIQMNVVVKMNCVGAQIVTAEKAIASVSLCGAFVTLAFMKKSMEMAVRLSDIVLLDMSPRSHFKKVLSYSDEDVFSANIIKRDLEEHDDVNDVDMVVKVRMGCMHLVVINYFVSSLTGFLNNFQAAQDVICEASAAAAQAAKENAKGVYAKASKMSLDIELKAPIVTIPINSFSLDGFLVDLGRLSITNTFETRRVNSQATATLDNISLTLDNMKVSRVRLEEVSHTVIGECGVLEPISFKLTVVRNLSSAWFKESPELDISAELQSIDLILSEADYSMAMKVLSENLGDVPEDIPKSTEATLIQTNTSISKVVINSKGGTLPGTPALKTEVNVFMKFSFTMQSLVIALHTGGDENTLSRCVNEKNIESGLARFTLNGLSVYGRMKSDSSLHTSLSLVDCLLDDLRHSKTSKIKRFMGSKNTKPDPENIPSNLSFDEENLRMVVLTVNMDRTTLLVDTLVNSFTLILSMDFLLSVKNFFVSKVPEAPETTTSKHYPASQTVVASQLSNASRATSAFENAAKTAPSKITKINLRLEKPDIVMVETMEHDTTNALVLNVEVQFKINFIEDVMSLNGSLKNFQLYVDNNFPRYTDETKSLVISPATLDVNGSKRSDGLKLDAVCTTLHIALTPGTLELLNRCYETLQVAPVKKDETLVEHDYSNIWGRRSFTDPEYWFLRTEKGLEASEMTLGAKSSVAVNVMSELVMVEFPKVIMTVEAGVGTKTMPMILVETNFQGKVKDFSSQMAVDCSLSLQVSYYNSRLALWEPLIEPVETFLNDKVFHNPWELKIDVEFNNQALLDESQLSSNDEDMEAVALPPRMKVSLSSFANLELTVTKTCLEVLNTLNEAFQSAIKSQLVSSTGSSTAPYQVQNHTGITVILDLESSAFQLANHKASEPIKKVVLESGATIALELQERKEVPGSPIAYPSTSPVERFLSVKPEKHNITLNLPVVRADKRYFALHQKGDTTGPQWGLISDVQVEDGGFVVTLRSIIQVHNDFSVPINVYFMTERGNELESVGTVEPNGKISLPLRAVYTPTSELFFSVEGYSVSISPFKWRDLQNSLVMSKLLQCEPKRAEEAEPFFLNVVGEMEQVFYENTTRHTMPSTCYNVHLRPPVILKNYLPWTVTCSLQGIPVQKTLEAGQHIQIPTVEPGSSTIVLTIPDYLDKKWSCKSPLKANPPELSVWPFESFDSMEKVTLNLGMHTITNNGSMIMALYAPFWMINKTGLNLSYKHSDEGGGIFFHPAHFMGPILLPYHSKDFHAKKKAAVKIEDEEWSSNFPLDVAGSSGQVACKWKGVVYQFGVNIELNSNSLTKRVLITPFYVISNNAPFAIECREDDESDKNWIKVEPKDCRPLWPKSVANEKNLRVRVAETQEMSAPFSYNTVYTVLLRLHNKYGGLNLDVMMTEGGVYLSFSPYEAGLAPALFVNHSRCDVKIWEVGTNTVNALAPRECLMFAWEKPTGDRTIRWSCNESKEVVDNLRKDGLGKITNPDNQKVFWVSFLDGTQRVVLFTTDDSVARDAQLAGEVEVTNMSVTLSIHGLGLSLVNNITKQELLYLGIASSGAIWETRKSNKSHFKQISAADNNLMEESWGEYQQEVEVGGASNPLRKIGKYMVNFEEMTVSQPNNRLLRRSFQTGLWINYRVSVHQVQIHVRVNRIQIDNQMPDCTFPVIFAPVPPPHSVAVDKALKPFLEMSIVKRLTEYSPVQQYKYCKVLVQEFHIKVDVSFLSSLSTFFEAEAISEVDEVKHFNADMSVIKDPLNSHVALQSTVEQKNFYDLLHFSPLKIHVSFSLGEEAGCSQNLPHVLNVFMQSVGVTLTEMHDVVFKLAYFEREYVFLTQAQLVAEAKMHYTGQLLKQLYVLVFGLDVIGNPFGLVVGLTKGVEDFFYEPFQGAIQGPGEFARGLVLGVRSLFGHTVGGAAGAASRITGTLGKGLAVLTFDDDYIRKRRENQNKRPANLHTGLAQSGKGLLMGVVDGVTGVVTKPVSGYKEGSWGGMFKGVGKGMAGLITRPTAGIVDFASGSFNAVKRATEMTDEVTRLRPPRYFQPDGVLRPYAKHEAEGNKILLELEKGRYSTTDGYIHHIVVAHSVGKEIVLITDKRIAYLKSNDIFGGWQVDWAYTWNELAEPPSAEPNGILLVASDQKKKKRLLGSSSNKRLLLVPDSEQRQRMVRKMEELYGKNTL